MLHRRPHERDLVHQAAALQVIEALPLQGADIDSVRMMIRVSQGKGGNDRYTLLSARLLEAVRAPRVSY